MYHWFGTRLCLKIKVNLQWSAYISIQWSAYISIQWSAYISIQWKQLFNLIFDFWPFFSIYKFTSKQIEADKWQLFFVFCLCVSMLFEEIKIEIKIFIVLSTINLAFLNQAKNNPVVLPSSQIKIWGKLNQKSR